MAKGQETSSSRQKGFSWFGKHGAIHDEVKCGSIYFATDKSNLTSDDKTAIKELVPDLLNVATLGHRVRIKCEGHTDRRAPDEYNMNLSTNRVESVLNFLYQQLLRYPLKDRYNIDIVRPFIRLSGRAYGERDARADRSLFSRDRRVDILVRVFPKTKSEENRGRKKRIERFRRYCPHYDKWVRRGLDYLVVQYESDDSYSRYVHIRPWDIEKVLELLKEIMDPKEYGALLRRAEGKHRNEIIAEAYEVEYRKIWGDLYLKYG